MFSKKVSNRIGSGFLRKCRGCKHIFGIITNRDGLGREFTLEEFELGFSVHEVTCLTSGIWKHVKFDKKVGSYETKD